MEYLKDRVCLITGGSNGIGEAIARNLIKEGVKVFDFSRTNKLQDKIEGQTENLKSYLGNVGSEKDVKNAFQKCNETFGTIDILINNAGVGIPTPDLTTATVEVYDNTMNTNVRGVFLCTREALKVMKPRKAGNIITIISMAGQRTNANSPIYVASKFGARGLNGGLADQVIKEGIKVTDINPGPVDTNYWGNRDVPRDKFLLPEDIANIVSFILCLPEHVLVREINFDCIHYLDSK